MMLRSVLARRINTRPSSLPTRRFVSAKHTVKPNSNKTFSSPPPVRSQQWSTFTTILLATLVGASGYIYGFSKSGNKEDAIDDSKRPTLPFPKPTKADFENALKEVKEALADPELVSTDKGDLLPVGTTEWSYHSPDCLTGAVIYPRSTEDVVKIVKIANKYSIPLVPVSGATSLEGHFNAPSAKPTVDRYEIDPDKLDPSYSFTLSFTQHMANIIAVHENDLDVVVQPGLSYEDLNKELKKQGSDLFFPVDPGPGAEIGGMVGTGCSGTNAIRYGTMRDNVLNVTVVLANGEVMKTRQRSKKSAAGPDIGKLIIGSEGTLGIVTEVTLKLSPRLPYSVGVSSFKTVQEAADAVADLVKSGVGLQCVELLDELMIKGANQAAASNKNLRQYPEQPSLFLKFCGTEEQIAQDIKRTNTILKKNNGTDPLFATNEKEKEDLWYARKVALWSAMDLKPGCRSLTTDVCVPISNLPQLVKECKEDFDKSGLLAPIVGHAGDGNFHALLLFSNDEELAIAKQLVTTMIGRAQKLDGTCTGEHGVGIGKNKYLEQELGPATVDVLKRIKLSLDPKNIMNPGKLYPS